MLRRVLHCHISGSSQHKQRKPATLKCPLLISPAPKRNKERFLVHWTRIWSVKWELTKSGSCHVTPKPSDNELSDFLDKLKNASPRAAVLSVAPKHSNDFVPKVLREGYPTPLEHLYDSENLGLTYSELCDKSLKVFEDLSITDEQCNNIRTAILLG